MKKKKKSCRFNMFEFESLIGLKKDDAIEILKNNGYNDIEIIINSKSNNLCDSYLVCKAEEKNGMVMLVLGEFYLNIKG